MPSYADSITPEEAWDLVHYIQSLRLALSEERQGGEVAGGGRFFMESIVRNERGPRVGDQPLRVRPGIEERHGRIPRWLAIVYVALLIWMVYYLVRFWTNQG